MEKKIRLEVVTPQRVVFEDDVEALIIPGIDGYIGIWSDHAPMVVRLDLGVIRYRKGQSLERIAITGGFLEIAKNKAVVLADSAELASEIDILRAREALERAKKRLDEKEGHLDFQRAQAALRRALNRLKAAGAE